MVSITHVLHGDYMRVWSHNEEKVFCLQNTSFDVLILNVDSFHKVSMWHTLLLIHELELRSSTLIYSWLNESYKVMVKFP